MELQNKEDKVEIWKCLGLVLTIMRSNLIRLCSLLGKEDNLTISTQVIERNQTRLNLLTTSLAIHLGKAPKTTS